MPFTLSHPAAVVPLFRLASHPTFVVALVVGSVAPDLGYYLRLFSLATVAHSFVGSLVVCVPAGFVLLWFLHIGRKPLLWLMPSRIRSMLGESFALSLGGRGMVFSKIALCLWIGSMTHILWDSFTHRTGWFVERLPALQTLIVLVDGHGFPVYYILQQASTVIGLLIVSVFAFRACSRRSAISGQGRGDLLRYGFWFVLVTVSIVLAVPFAMCHASDFEGLLRFRSIVFQTGILSGAIFAVLTIVSLVIVSLKGRRIGK